MRTVQTHRAPPGEAHRESFHTWGTMLLLILFYGLTVWLDMFIGIAVVMFLMCLLWGERRLPVAAFEPPFEQLFLTRHGLDFAHAAALYGLDHVRVGDQAAFAERFAAAVAGDTPTIVEVITDGAADLALQHALVAEIQAAVREGAGV